MGKTLFVTCFWIVILKSSILSFKCDKTISTQRKRKLENW